jgi:hypothetical protein
MLNELLKLLSLPVITAMYAEMQAIIDDAGSSQSVKIIAYRTQIRMIEMAQDDGEDLFEMMDFQLGRASRVPPDFQPGVGLELGFLPGD